MNGVPWRGTSGVERVLTSHHRRQASGAVALRRHGACPGAPGPLVSLAVLLRNARVCMLPLSSLPNGAGSPPAGPQGLPFEQEVQTVSVPPVFADECFWALIGRTGRRDLHANSLGKKTSSKDMGTS